MTFNTFLFDLDGTLIDSLADLTDAVNLLRGEFGLAPLPPETVRTFVGDGAAMLVRRVLPEELLAGATLERFLALYRGHLREKTTVYPGIPEFLVRHREKKLGVVTNKPLALTLELLRGFGLLPFFGVVLGAESCPTRKPDPGPVLSALAELGSEPATALLFGDHHTDLAAGRGAGVRTCFCAWGLGVDGGLPHDYRAERPADLLRLFPAKPQ